MTLNAGANLVAMVTGKQASMAKGVQLTAKQHLSESVGTIVLS